MDNSTNPFDSRLIGVKIVYMLLRKTVKDTVEEFIKEMNINPIDAADIRHNLLVKDILKIHVPCTTDEEEDAFDWLDEIRSRVKRGISKSSKV